MCSTRVQRDGRWRALVIGVGNPYRRDDAVGREVVRRLRRRALSGVRLVEQDGEGTALLEVWEGADLVILVDAVASGAAPGTVHRFDAAEGPLPATLARGSTHAMGVAEAVELARALGQLPRRLLVYGIEGEHFSPGVGLSARVREAVDRVVASILQDLRGGGTRDG